MRDKRELILLSYFGFIFLFGMFIIDSSFGKQYNEKEKRKLTKIISFDYGPNHYETTKDTLMVFNGYKYLVLKTTSQKAYDIFPKQEVKNLKMTIKN